MRRIRFDVCCAFSSRQFGNAPNRVRPMEIPNDGAGVTQTNREVSAVSAIAAMIVVPLWALVLWADWKARGNEEKMRWAKGYLASDDPWKRKQQNSGGEP